MQEERNPQQDEELEARTGRADEEVEAHIKHRTGRAEEEQRTGRAEEDEEVEAHRFFQQPEDPGHKH
jgi:hypothetical protein